MELWPPLAREIVVAVRCDPWDRRRVVIDWSVTAPGLPAGAGPNPI